MTMIVYADFACPRCYLASRRVDALRAIGVAVDWRAVEHRPETPIAGAHLDAAHRNTLTTEFAELSGMLRGNSPAHPLRESGYAVSVARGPITTGGYQRMRAWRAEWLQLGLQLLPGLLDGAVTLVGPDVVRRLGKEIDYLSAVPTPELGNPRRYPEMSVHPNPAWVSQIGQRGHTRGDRSRLTERAAGCSGSGLLCGSRWPRQRRPAERPAH